MVGEAQNRPLVEKHRSLEISRRHKIHINKVGADRLERSFDTVRMFNLRI